MIQRIQTVWLFLIAVLSGLLFFMPITETVNPEIVPASFPFETLLMIGNGVIAIFAVIIIFFYKNRPLQLKLSQGLFVLLVLSCVMIAYYIWSSPTDIIYKYPIVFPIIAIVFDMLAIYSIKKDEKLVRSLDRLR